MNCLGYIRRPKTLHCQRPSEAEKRKDSTECLMQSGLSTPTIAIQCGGKKRKGTTFAKETAATAPSEPAPKRKRVKVLTHRPRYIEPATVPEFAGETSLATEAEEPTLLPEVKEMTEVPATEKMEEPKTEEAKASVEGVKISEILSPSEEIEASKIKKGPTVTPKRKRMVNVLDVLETIKLPSTTPKKTAETFEALAEVSVAEAPKQHTGVETGPSGPTKVMPLEAEETKSAKVTEEMKMSGPTLVEEIDTAAPEASSKIYDYIVRHASGKKLSEEEVFEANHYAKELKYPKGALVFNGTNEEDFLYCLPDNKELSVCREMARSMGFPKLEAGLCAMTKDDLADSLAYNSLKVRELRIWKFYDLKTILLFLYQLFYI
jgi:hypothetical protein